MEACDSYRPWRDKATGKSFVRPDGGKCLRYYFYLLDAAFGLIYLRVPPRPSPIGAKNFLLHPRIVSDSSIG